MSRVALVTGAARGIGATTVRGLVEDGWSVVALDRCADDPHLSYPLSTPAELHALAGPQVLCVEADCRDAGALAGAVALAEERFGGLDAAVGAAGVVAGGTRHWETDLDAERTVMEVDLLALMTLARVSVPAMLRRPDPRSGRFVAIASSAATKGLPLLSAYCAAKAGLTGFVRALAVELAPLGVTANTVSPGSTDTAMLAATAALYGVADPETLASDHQPIRRSLRTDEIAAAIRWLLSDAASAVTGLDMHVDGGMVL